MSALAFKKATKKAAKARIALMGPSGSGKTVTALRVAAGLGKRIAVIDTEHASASKYAGEFGDFDSLELESFEPQNYVDAIQLAERAGYDVLIIDSLSHAWSGKGGALEQVDQAAKRSQSGNSYTAWRDVTPQHNRLIDAIVGCKCHVIATMRTKTEYVLEEVVRGGKTIKQPRRVGLAAVQREGMEYEFDVVCDVTLDHDVCVTKTRCAALDGAVIRKAGEDFGATLLSWLTDGAKVLTKFDHYWPLFKNSSNVGKPLSEVPTESLLSYIERLEKALKDEKYKADASKYYGPALAEVDARRRKEAAAAGANPETGELPDQEAGAPFPADPSEDPAHEHSA